MDHNGFKVGGKDGGGVLILHILFMDDSLLFCKASSEQLLYLRWVLFCFKAVSGLKINLENSELFLVGLVRVGWAVGFEF